MFAGLAMKKDAENLQWLKRRLMEMNREENPIIAWLEDTAMERGEERGDKKGAAPGITGRDS
jgi:hypothetical protein